MNRPPAPLPSRFGAALSGVIAALVFNACAILLPVSGAAVVRAFQDPDIIDFTPAPATIAETQKALARELSRFAPLEGSRRENWNNLIAREMAEDDIAAARGFALAAPHLLNGADAAKIRRQVSGGGDQALVAATLPLIEPVYARQRFRAVMNRRDDPGAFDVLSDAGEVARMGERWLGGEQIDYFLFALSGATLPAAGIDPARDNIRLGASVVKIARNNARLTPGFTSLIGARIRAAAPPDAVRRAFAETFQNREAIVDESAAAALAFQRAINAEALDVLRADLAHIGATARAASPAGAVHLLSQAHTEHDLRRIELLAVAGGDRAVAVAKRSASGLALDAARGVIRWDQALVGNLIAMMLAALGLFITTHVALMAAIRRQWEDPPAPRRPSSSAPMSKAEAQRRARENARRADAPV